MSNVMDWQPIENAPKDKLIILAGQVSDESDEWLVLPGQWEDGFEDGQDYMGHDGGFIDMYYSNFFPARSFGNPTSRYAGCQPTKWMPLPTVDVTKS